MASIIANTLKTLRKEKGYSLEAVGQLVGVSRQTIHKYEKGLKTPSPETLIKVSEALGVHPSRFFETDVVDIEFDKIEFREEHNIYNKKDEVLGIKKEILEHVINYIDLRNLLSLRQNFTNPLRNITVRSEKDVERAAKTLRRKWGLGSSAIADLTTLLESKGVMVIEINRPSGFTGLSGYVNKEIPVITINRNITDITRKRFTLAHELAHLLLDFEEGLTNRVERLCDYFAGAVLIVDDALIEELGRNRTRISVTELIRIKEKYGISVQAIMIRAKAVGLISYQTSREWWEEYQRWYESGQHHITTDRSSNLYAEVPTKFHEMLTRALSENRITWSKAAEISNKKVDYLKEELKQLEFAL